jgi:hypothetical protein
MPEPPEFEVWADRERFVAALSPDRRTAYTRWSIDECEWQQRQVDRESLRKAQAARAEFDALPPPGRVAELLRSHQAAFGRKHTPDRKLCQEILGIFGGNVARIEAWVQGLVAAKKKPDRSDGWYRTLALAAAERSPPVMAGD